MRTTLTLDDDIAALLQQRAQQLGLSFKDVVNKTLRAGLGEAGRRPQRPPKTIPHAYGFRPGVDLDKLNQLADELEAEAFVAAGPKRRK
jgi:hypothetical protein